MQPEQGCYSKKQLHSDSGLIAWSHQGRFRVARALAADFAGRRVLDYGCGDATFLAMLDEAQERPALAVGAEVDPGLVRDCARRLSGRPSLRFVHISELDQSAHERSYDVIVCMEVLEHVTNIEPILDRFDRLLVPSGRLLVSVPVEIGAPLIVKQMVRQIAGWRGIGDYPGTSPYRLTEYFASVTAGRRQHMARPLHGATEGQPFHDHKGFNWMALQEALCKRFRLDRRLGSPMTWLTPHLNSQVWFLMSKP